jgi:uncharacterized protein YbjT (DUF2867 family)
MPELILVTGATGEHGGTGQALVRRLREAGSRVRVLVRQNDARSERLLQLGAQIVVGDLVDRNSLLPALDGVEAAYFTFPIDHGIIDAAANFSAAAREKKLSKLVIMSMGAAHPQSPSHLARAQWLAEEIFSWAGLDIIVLRIAAMFMENLPTLHRHSVIAEGVIRNSFGEAKVPWISGSDAAELAAVALIEPSRFNQDRVQYPPGAELVSHREIAKMLSSELDREIRFEAISREEWRNELASLAQTNANGVINADMASHISALGAMFSSPGKEPVRAPDKAELGRLIGRNPLSMMEFLNRERYRFRMQKP